MDPLRLKYYDIIKGASISSGGLTAACQEIVKHQERYISNVRNFIRSEYEKFGERVTQRTNTKIHTAAKGVIRLAIKSAKENNYDEIRQKIAVIDFQDDQSASSDSDFSISSKSSTRSRASAMSTTSSRSLMSGIMESTSSRGHGRGRPRSNSPSKGRPRGRGHGRGDNSSARDSYQNSYELRSNYLDSETSSLMEMLEELKADRFPNKMKKYKTFWFHVFLQEKFQMTMKVYKIQENVIFHNIFKFQTGS